MPIELIESHEAFCQLENDWQRLYRADHEASVFLSWRWMHSLLMARVDQPLIIAWYDDSTDKHIDECRRYGAFLPLRRQVRLSASRAEFYNAISFAGNYWADYTGVLCDPSMEEQALPDIGAALLNLGWRRLFLTNSKQSPQRIKALLAPLRIDENIKVKPQQLTDNDGATDLSKAPVVILQDSFDAWLKNSLSANTRQKLRRIRRQLCEDDTLTIQQSTPATHEMNIAALERLWCKRWSAAKGQRVEKLGKKYAAFVREGLDAGDMKLFVLFQEERPIALHACYVDTDKRVMSFFVGARDITFLKLPAGLVLHAHAIEWAIQNALRHYDLLRGDEAYKYSLGAVDQAVESFQVTRQHLPVAHRFLDIECRTAALEALAAYQREARLSRVHELYSQLLESWPDDANVLEQYAAWLRVIGDNNTANEITNTLHKSA